MTFAQTSSGHLSSGPNGPNEMLALAALEHTDGHRLTFELNASTRRVTGTTFKQMVAFRVIKCPFEPAIYAAETL